MNLPQFQYGVPELLARAGATLRGRNRADCPKCGRRRTVSHTEELYCCHHNGCQFKGNAFTLAKELGLAQGMSAQEAKAFQESRERARRATEWIARKIRQRRHALQQAHRDLLDIRFGALKRLDRNRQDQMGWDGLAYHYREMPRVEAELAILEDSLPAERLAFINSTEVVQKGKVVDVVRTRGLESAEGKFIWLGSLDVVMRARREDLPGIGNNSPDVSRK